MSTRTFVSIGLALTAFVTSAVLGAACGGTVTESTTGDPGECPAETPLGGDACDLPDGTHCEWDFYCGSPTTFGTCESGKWQIAVAEAQPQVCPAEAPNEGDACCNEEGLSCVYGACDPDGKTGPGFACSGGVWTAETVPCIPCGDTACNTDGLCVEHEGFGSSYECIEDPCGGTTACECAGYACDGDACAVKENVLVCSCLSC